MIWDRPSILWNIKGQSFATVGLSSLVCCVSSHSKIFHCLAVVPVKRNLKTMLTPNIFKENMKLTSQRPQRMYKPQHQGKDVVQCCNHRWGGCHYQSELGSPGKYLSNPLTATSIFTWNVSVSHFPVRIFAATKKISLIFSLILRLTIRIGYLHSLEVKSDLANIFLTFGDLPLTTACIRVRGRVARVPIVWKMPLKTLTVARLYSTVQYSTVQYWHSPSTWYMWGFCW